MIKEFTANGYKYVMVSPSVVISKVKINGKDISKYLTDDTTLGWYDVSKDSGRNTTTANGKMILNIIATKWRLDLKTRILTDDELVDFYSEIIKKPTMTVEFFNPYTKSWKTISCYRGDRQVQTKNIQETPDRTVQIYQGVSQALIEL